MNHVRLAKNTAVVTATADYEPLNNLPKLEIELREKQFEGSVVFDLLYFNGLSDNRFIEIIFDGHKFNRKSYKTRSRIDAALKIYQDLFFISRPALLATSVLSSKELKNFTASESNK